MSLGDSIKKSLWFGVVIIAAAVIRPYIWPEKTNGQYLHELIDNGYIQKMAAAYVETIKKANANTAPTPTEVQWVQIEKGLSECVVKQANSFLASGDSYLSKRADKTTPLVLARRFLDACNVGPDESSINAKGGDPQSMQSPVSRFQDNPADQVPPSADDLKKAANQEGHFLEFQGDVHTTTFDLKTVQIIQPGRFSVVSTTIDYPFMMTFELKAFDTL